MTYAVLQDAHGGQPVRDTMVINRIVLNEDQREAYEQASGFVLIPSAPLGLTIGDLYTDAGWTRNIDGEQVVLTIEERRDENVDELMRIIEGGKIDGIDD